MPNLYILSVFTALLFIFSPTSLNAETSKLTLTLKSGSEHQAVLYDAEGDKAVILLHQYGKAAQSWSPLALPLQKVGVTSIALHILSSHGVHAAAEELARMGKRDIILIGASMGGGILRDTVSETTPDLVNKVIFLATADHGPVLSPDLQKLYIVAKKDVYAKAAYSAYESAAKPKRLIEYTGNKHAQELFESEHVDDLTQQILNFINE